MIELRDLCLLIFAIVQMDVSGVTDGTDDSVTALNRQARESVAWNRIKDRILNVLV